MTQVRKWSLSHRLTLKKHNFDVGTFKNDLFEFYRRKTKWPPLKAHFPIYLSNQHFTTLIVRKNGFHCTGNCLWNLFKFKILTVKTVCILLVHYGLQYLNVINFTISEVFNLLSDLFLVCLFIKSIRPKENTEKKTIFHLLK